jgi:hypothetical protein
VVKQAIALFALTAALPITATLILVHYGVPALEEATKKQCITHDWPADKAVATSKWCVANGYKI